MAMRVSPSMTRSTQAAGPAGDAEAEVEGGLARGGVPGGYHSVGIELAEAGPEGLALVRVLVRGDGPGLVGVAAVRVGFDGGAELEDGPGALFGGPEVVEALVLGGGPEYGPDVGPPKFSTRRENR